MDIKEKINQIAEAFIKDASLREQFQKEPVKVIEKVLGVDLPDDMAEKIIDGVKARITVDKAADLAGSLKNLF